MDNHYLVTAFTFSVWVPDGTSSDDVATILANLDTSDSVSVGINVFMGNLAKFSHHKEVQITVERGYTHR